MLKTLGHFLPTEIIQYKLTTGIPFAFILSKSLTRFAIPIIMPLKGRKEHDKVMMHHLETKKTSGLLDFGVLTFEEEVAKAAALAVARARLSSRTRLRVARIA